MNFEWQAEKSLSKIEDLLKKDLDRIRGSKSQRERNKTLLWVAQVMNSEGSQFQPIEDLYTKLKLLAQSEDEIFKHVYKQILTDHKDQVTEYFEEKLRVFKQFDIDKPTPENINLKFLPENSFLFSSQIQLVSPYLSKDETAFYIHDNPVKKEWVLKIPMVSASSWKGSFRAALIRNLAEKKLAIDKLSETDKRLFGNSKSEEKDFQRGCLYFYPSYFTEMSLEIINPHNREKGTGTTPIYLECVPKESKANFSLLYIPVYPGLPKDAENAFDSALNDMEIILKSLEVLFTEQGIGAKTSAGNGLVNLGKSSGQIHVCSRLKFPETNLYESPERKLDSMQDWKNDIQNSVKR